MKNEKNLISRLGEFWDELFGNLPQYLVYALYDDKSNRKLIHKLTTKLKFIDTINDAQNFVAFVAPINTDKNYSKKKIDGFVCRDYIDLRVLFELHKRKLSIFKELHLDLTCTPEYYYSSSTYTLKDLYDSLLLLHKKNDGDKCSVYVIWEELLHSKKDRILLSECLFITKNYFSQSEEFEQMLSDPTTYSVADIVDSLNIYVSENTIIDNISVLSRYQKSSDWYQKELREAKKQGVLKSNSATVKKLQKKFEYAKRVERHEELRSTIKTYEEQIDAISQFQENKFSDLLSQEDKLSDDVVQYKEYLANNFSDSIMNDSLKVFKRTESLCEELLKNLKYYWVYAIEKKPTLLTQASNRLGFFPYIIGSISPQRVNQELLPYLLTNYLFHDFQSKTISLFHADKKKLTAQQIENFWEAGDPRDKRKLPERILEHFSCIADDHSLLEIFYVFLIVAHSLEKATPTIVADYRISLFLLVRDQNISWNLIKDYDFDPSSYNIDGEYLYTCIHTLLTTYQKERFATWAEFFLLDINLLVDSVQSSKTLKGKTKSLQKQGWIRPLKNSASK